MANYYCKYCGAKYPNPIILKNNSCNNNPSKRHVLYEGSEKSQYTCKHCKNVNSSIALLTNNACSKSPTKKHEPAL